MPAKKSTKQIKKTTLHPKAITRNDIAERTGIGMEFDFNPELTVTLKVVERLEAIMMHLFFSVLAFFTSLYFILMGKNFTSVSYRK